MFKRLISVVLTIFLLMVTMLTAIPSSAQAEQQELSEGIFDAVSDDLHLSLDTKTAQITVCNLKTGVVWRSNPEDCLSDPIAAGENKTRLRSQLYITYVNNMRQQKSTNSYVDSLNKSGCRFYKIKDGFRLEYTFEKGQFIIPVEYTVSENIFYASVVFSEIKELGDNRLISVSLLPFFGAGGPQATGEIFVPDGCGALIKMNNGKTSCLDFNKRFYGEELSVPSSDKSLNSQKLLLPVFGITNGDAFLARVVSGAELASLTVSPGGKDTSYNVAYTTAFYRCIDRESALQNDAKTTYAYLAENAVSLKRYTVEYIFGDNNNASFSDLAALYRERLKTQLSYDRDKNAEQNFISVDLYGGVKKKTSFLGFVYEGKLAVTSYKEMQDILADLKKNCKQDISAQLTMFSKSDFNGVAAKNVDPMAFLGGKKDYKKLISYCESNDIALYPSVNLSTMLKSGNGFSVFKSVVSGMNQQSVRVGMDVKNSRVAKKYLLNVNSIFKASEKIFKSGKKYDLSGVLFTEEGTRLYSDFGKKSTYRDDMATQYKKVFEYMSKEMGLAFEAAYEYMLPYAESIVNVPVGSSKNMLFDLDVPFYQMAVMGKSCFSSNSYNITNPSRDYFLACIESSTALKFTVGMDESELLGLGNSQSHNIGYDELRDTIIALSNEAYGFFSKVKGAVLVDFVRYSNNTSVGRYDNGITVYTNRSEKDTVIDGVNVDAFDFKIIEVDAE